MIVPEATDLERARRIHAHFAAQPLSKHIASEWSLAHVSALQKQLKPQRILEIGAGIGCLTSMLLYSGAQVVAVEPLAEFRGEHGANIGPHPRLKLVADLEGVEPPFDLIVIDGDFPDGFERMKTPGTTVFIEGVRAHQRAELSPTKFTTYLPDGLIERAGKLRKRKKGCHIGVIA